MSPDVDTLAILGAVLGVAGVLMGGLFRIYQGTKAIHILVNSNLSRVRLDLRMAITAMFIAVLVAIVAVYKGIARLREPPK